MFSLEISNAHYIFNHLRGKNVKYVLVLLLPESWLSKCSVSIVKGILHVSFTIEHVIT